MASKVSPEIDAAFRRAVADLREAINARGRRIQREQAKHAADAPTDGARIAYLERRGAGVVWRLLHEDYDSLSGHPCAWHVITEREADVDVTVLGVGLTWREAVDDAMWQHP